VKKSVIPVWDLLANSKNSDYNGFWGGNRELEIGNWKLGIYKNNYLFFMKYFLPILKCGNILRLTIDVETFM
jgi:hypothetical protein